MAGQGLRAGQPGRGRAGSLGHEQYRTPVPSTGGGATWHHFSDAHCHASKPRRGTKRPVRVARCGTRRRVDAGEAALPRRGPGSRQKRRARFIRLPLPGTEPTRPLHRTPGSWRCRSDCGFGGTDRREGERLFRCGRLPPSMTRPWTAGSRR